MVVEICSRVQCTKPLKKNEKGFYVDIPVAVLDKVSRNNTYYESQSFIEAMTSDGSPFKMRLLDGNLTGELGHPDMSKVIQGKEVERFLSISPQEEAVLFNRVRTEPIPGLGVVIFADVKGHGARGKEFEEKMREPYANCSFSLRAFTVDKQVNGYISKQARTVITFDCGMAGGGFAEATKENAYKFAKEGLDMYSTDEAVYHNSVTKNDILPYAGMSTESLCTFDQVNQIFDYAKIIQGERVIGLFDDNGRVILNEGNNQIVKSRFNAMFNL
jgi:hypothetical protein